MAKRDEEKPRGEGEVQPSKGGKGIDQGGPANEQQRMKEEAEQAAQKAKDRAGSNAGPSKELPPKYTLTPEEEAKRNKTLRQYIVGDVGEKGQFIRGVKMMRGQTVYLTPEEASQQQRGGVPLTEVEDVERPAEQV